MLGWVSGLEGGPEYWAVPAALAKSVPLALPAPASHCLQPRATLKSLYPYADVQNGHLEEKYCYPNVGFSFLRVFFVYKDFFISKM